MQVERIDVFDDPRITDYRNLKDKRLLAALGRFVVAGRVNLRVMLERSPFVPDSILLSERTHRLMDDELTRLVPSCPAAESRNYRAQFLKMFVYLRTTSPGTGEYASFEV